MKTWFVFPICSLLSTVCALAQTPAKTAPKPIETSMPAYPAALVDTGISGNAVLDVLVKTDGTIDDARVKSADHEAFGAAALSGISSWRFEPGTVDGAPVDMRVAIPFKFFAPREQQFNAMFKRKVFTKLTEPVLDEKAFGKKLKLKDKVAPIYPRELRGSGIEEKVVVAFVVAPDGTTQNPVVEGKPRKEILFSALVAVVRSTYVPPVKDGQGVYVQTRRTIQIAPPQRRGGGGGGGGFGDGGGGDGGGGGGDFGGGGGGGGGDF